MHSLKSNVYYQPSPPLHPDTPFEIGRFRGQAIFVELPLAGATAQFLNPWRRAQKTG